MSPSKNGLQYCLDELEFYCDNWYLQINIRKTKIVLFNRQGSPIKKHKFQFKQNIIETVREYKYSIDFLLKVIVHDAASEARVQVPFVWSIFPRVVCYSVDCVKVIT